MFYYNLINLLLYTMIFWIFVLIISISLVWYFLSEGSICIVIYFYRCVLCFLWIMLHLLKYIHFWRNLGWFYFYFILWSLFIVIYLSRWVLCFLWIMLYMLNHIHYWRNLGWFSFYFIFFFCLFYFIGLSYLQMNFVLFGIYVYD